LRHHLADAVGAGSHAVYFLVDVGFPRTKLPVDAPDASRYWQAVFELCDNGVVDDPYRRLLAAALVEFPANPTFVRLGAAYLLASSRADGEPDESAVAATVPTPAPRPPRLWFRRRALWAVAGVLVLIPVVPVLVAVVPNAGNEVCRPEPLRGNRLREAPFVLGPAQQDVSVGSVWYSLAHDSADAWMTLAVDLSGNLPSGDRVVVLSTPSRSTTSSRDVVGNGKSFHSDEFDLTPGCNKFPENLVGHPGAVGLRYTFWLLQLDEAQYAAFVQAKHRPDYPTEGFNLDWLRELGVCDLGRFDVDTV
jgi:hypothetical protein